MYSQRHMTCSEHAYIEPEAYEHACTARGRVRVKSYVVRSKEIDLYSLVLKKCQLPSNIPLATQLLFFTSWGQGTVYSTPLLGVTH